ncbi:MAG: hypothetical protein KAS65_06160 [Candidatus Aminicenantes bacterium]|nr:hypothetical protein [Candidatus Aminicenantes bacterium]
MKRSIIFLMCILFILGSFVDAGELSFENFEKLITKNVVLAGFTLNKSRTFDMKSSFHVEFKGDEEKAEMIAITLFLKWDEFSKMDKLGKPELYKFKDRPALFSDGNKAGMASFSLILKNKKGKLTINHRVFGGKFLGKADLEKIVEKIGLKNLEK